MLKRIGDINAILHTGDPTYSAAEIVGQSLIAKTPVITYDEPYDDAKPVGAYGPGQTVGIVTSWVDADPSNDRSVLYWQFSDQHGNFYYAPHQTGEFDVQALADAGALTVGQQTQAAIDANKSTLQTEFEKYIPWVIGGVLGIIMLNVLLKNSSSKD